MKNIFFVLILFPNICLASLIINEIAWMGTTTSPNDEWIELFNNSDKIIDLNGWKLVSKDGSPEINLEGFVHPQGFFVLERTDDTTVPNILADQIYTGSLKNTGEYIELTNNQVIDQANFQNGWTHGDNETKQTMERNNNSWQTSQNPGGTPKTQNSEVIIQEKPIIPNQKQDISPETPTTYPSNIFFNEILPSPEGSDSENEYVEIFNNNEFSVNLLNWTLKDTQGSIKKYIFPNTVVKSKSFLILYRPQTKITLNNATDGLELLNPNNKVVDQITYESAPKAESYNKGEPWKWSNAPTPGKQNTITQENLEIKPNNLGANIVKQPIKKTDSNFTLLFSLALIVCLIFGLIVFLVNKQGKIYDKEDE